MFWTSRSPMAIGKDFNILSFPTFLRLAKLTSRRDSSAVGNIHALLRIDLFLINLLKVEARDFIFCRVDSRRESDDKNAFAFLKDVSQLGCLFTRFRFTRLKVSGNPIEEVLEPIQKVRFTKSTPRQTSIRERKRPSLGKINVQVLHHRSRTP